MGRPGRLRPSTLPGSLSFGGWVVSFSLVFFCVLLIVTTVARRYVPLYGSSYAWVPIEVRYFDNSRGPGAHLRQRTGRCACTRGCTARILLTNGCSRLSGRGDRRQISPRTPFVV